MKSFCCKGIDYFFRNIPAVTKNRRLPEESELPSQCSAQYLSWRLIYCTTHGSEAPFFYAKSRTFPFIVIILLFTFHTISDKITLRNSINFIIIFKFQKEEIPMYN